MKIKLNDGKVSVIIDFNSHSNREYILKSKNFDPVKIFNEAAKLLPFKSAAGGNSIVLDAFCGEKIIKHLLHTITIQNNCNAGQVYRTDITDCIGDSDGFIYHGTLITQDFKINLWSNPKLNIPIRQIALFSIHNIVDSIVIIK